MIQINIPLPKTCSDCPIAHIEEDINATYYYDCKFINIPMYDSARRKRHRDCPLREVKEKEE